MLWVLVDGTDESGITVPLSKASCVGYGIISPVGSISVILEFGMVMLLSFQRFVIFSFRSLCFDKFSSGSVVLRETSLLRETLLKS